MKLVEFTSSQSGPFFAFPLSQAPSFTNWASKRVALTGSNGYFSGSVNTTLDGNIWLIFSGASAPASFDAWVGKVDFSNDEIPRFGDAQRWTNPTDSLDVTVTRVS
jgi:hypothetical protein